MLIAITRLCSIASAELVLNGLTAATFESSGGSIRGFVYYDANVPDSDTNSDFTGRWDFNGGANAGLGATSSTGVFVRGVEQRNVIVRGANQNIFATLSSQRLPGQPDDSNIHIRGLMQVGIVGPPVNVAEFFFSAGDRSPGAFVLDRLPSPVPAVTTTFSSQSPSTFANVSVRPMTERDILEKSVTVDINGSDISASFKPFGGAMSLAEAARFLGVDHFNWRQTVSGPGNMQIQTWSSPVVSPIVGNTNSVTSGQFLSTAQVVVDPVLGNTGTEAYVFRVDGSGPNDVKYGVVSTPGFTPDAFPFYMNERPLELDNRSDDFASYYFDGPRVPDWALSGTSGLAAPGYNMSFETSIVGVDSNGNIVPFSIAGTKFRWRSNAVIDTSGVNGGIGGFVWLRSGRSDNAPPLASGGIFDFEFVAFAVPEPSSVALASICGLTGLVFLISRPR